MLCTLQNNSLQMQLSIGSVDSVTICRVHSRGIDDICTMMFLKDDYFHKSMDNLFLNFRLHLK